MVCIRDWRLASSRPCTHTHTQYGHKKLVHSWFTVRKKKKWLPCKYLSVGTCLSCICQSCISVPNYLPNIKKRKQTKTKQTCVTTYPKSNPHVILQSQVLNQVQYRLKQKRNTYTTTDFSWRITGVVLWLFISAGSGACDKPTTLSVCSDAAAIDKGTQGVEVGHYHQSLHQLWQGKLVLTPHQSL